MRATKIESSSADVTPSSPEPMRVEYVRRSAAIRGRFAANGDGQAAVRARSDLMDDLVVRLWEAETSREPKLRKGIGIAAVGGYGRRQLFPYSDVDLLFCVSKGEAALAKEPIRRVSQALWDCGMQVSMTTRAPGDCERFDRSNPEFGLSLLDGRFLGGDADVLGKIVPAANTRMVQKDARVIGTELVALTRERHAKFGGTLFHLEPNVKDGPGGLRDANICGWLRRLRGEPEGSGQGQDEFGLALKFLFGTRCFLHYRHERDDNTLDWAAQDGAAEEGVGLGAGGQAVGDAAYWMRAYFRHARMVERRLLREWESSKLRIAGGAAARRPKQDLAAGVLWEDGRIDLEVGKLGDAAQDPETVLQAFALAAKTGASLAPAAEERIAEAIPLLSAHLEEGPGLWRKLSGILTGEHAAAALRSMHALGVLELILPEFHGIDALVIRDAYHRYTVDEHTFVLVQTLHELEQDAGRGAPDWRVKFQSMVRELQNPGLLYLAALLHDTGKARMSGEHAKASAQMAKAVLERLEMDAYDAGLVMRLIETHLEMSAALRRDIFDYETVRSFAAKVQTQELLRMLTLFTYADIQAVHPNALTPWKAENLWRLSMATANQLDRHVDEQRVHARERAGGAEKAGSGQRDHRIDRVRALAAGSEGGLEEFLEGFPERYIETRAPEAVLAHFRMTQRFAQEPLQIAFKYGVPTSEITLVTQDRPRLFAGMAAALAAWGMNVVTADAFANAAGVVVDSFRFSDTFSTLELNESERERFAGSVREMLAGSVSVEKMLGARRRGKRKAPRVVVETRIEFDAAASSHSTLLQVVAQDVPGLLRTISLVLSEQGYNVEVALIDTEGETAIDVFYLTRGGQSLTAEQQGALRDQLVEAIGENAG